MQRCSWKWFATAGVAHRGLALTTGLYVPVSRELHGNANARQLPLQSRFNLSFAFFPVLKPSARQPTVRWSNTVESVAESGSFHSHF